MPRCFVPSHHLIDYSKLLRLYPLTLQIIEYAMPIWIAWVYGKNFSSSFSYCVHSLPWSTSTIRRGNDGNGNLIDRSESRICCPTDDHCTYVRMAQLTRKFVKAFPGKHIPEILSESNSYFLNYYVLRENARAVIRKKDLEVLNHQKILNWSTTNFFGALSKLCAHHDRCGKNCKENCSRHIPGAQNIPKQAIFTVFSHFLKLWAMTVR